MEAAAVLMTGSLLWQYVKQSVGQHGGGRREGEGGEGKGGRIEAAVVLMTGSLMWYSVKQSVEQHVQLPEQTRP